VLISDDGRLSLALGTRQEQTRLSARRTYDDRTFRPTVRSLGGRIFDELEFSTRYGIPRTSSARSARGDTRCS
jgi:hypothetical protein